MAGNKHLDLGMESREDKAKGDIAKEDWEMSYLHFIGKRN